MKFPLDNYPSRAAQWLAAREYMTSDPRKPLDRVGPRPPVAASSGEGVHNVNDNPNGGKE